MKYKIICVFLMSFCFSLHLMSNALPDRDLGKQKTLSNNFEKKVGTISASPKSGKKLRTQIKKKKITNTNSEKNNLPPKTQAEVDPISDKKEEKIMQITDNDFDIWTLDSPVEQKKNLKRHIIIGFIAGIIGSGFTFYLYKKMPIFFNLPAKKFQILKNFTSKIWDSVKEFGKAPPSSITMEEEKRIMQKLEPHKTLLKLSKIAHSLSWIPSAFFAIFKIKKAFS